MTEEMTERIVTAIPEDNPDKQRRFFAQNWQEPPSIEVELSLAQTGQAQVESPYPFIRGLVDVRAKLPTEYRDGHGPQESRPLSSKSDLIVHYHGVDVDQDDSWSVIYNAARDHINRDWNEGKVHPPIYGDGLMYHICVGTDGTKYLCRSLEDVLWHCGAKQNYTGLAVECPLGPNQKASSAQLRSLREVVSDWLQYKEAARSVVKGHKEVSKTSCPGPLMQQFVLPFRAEQSELPFELRKYNLVHNTPPGKERSEWVVREGNSRGGTELFAAAGGAKAISYAGREAALNQPAGALVTVVVGEEDAKSHLEAEGKAALANTAKFGKDVSDVWDGGTDEKLYACLEEMHSREPALKDKGLLKDFEETFGVEVTKVTDLWGVPGAWLHWEWGAWRPPRYAPNQKHWGIDAAPGDVQPHLPHGPALYTLEDGRWAIKAPFKGTVVRVNNRNDVLDYYNDLVVAYDVTHLDYPVDTVYALYGHLKDYLMPPAGTRVEPGDVICYLGDKRLSMGEIIHVHIEVFWTRDDALFYRHASTKDPMVVWEAHLKAQGGDGRIDYAAIAGKPIVTKDQCRQFASNRGAPDYVLDEWVDLDWRWGEATGIRPDILFAQQMLETNFGKFTGKVTPEYHNVAGIKIKNPSNDDLPEDHQKFPNWSEGVRAHANHLCAYTGLKPVLGPNGEPLHDRYFVVIRLSWAGTVKTIDGLSGRYAPRPDYHVLLRDSFLKRMGAWG